MHVNQLDAPWEWRARAPPVAKSRVPGRDAAEGGATTLPPNIKESFKMAPGVNPIFPAEDAFEIDVGTPDGRTLPLRSPELKAMIEQRAGSRQGDLQ
jgi:hypothetical protein